MIDYVDQNFQNENIDDSKSRFLSIAHAQLYCMDKSDNIYCIPPALQQLDLLRRGEKLSDPEYLSDRIKNQGEENKEIVNEQYEHVKHFSPLNGPRLSKQNLQHILNLIEFSNADNIEQ